MPFFSKLFELLPDAEELLSLEPEQLAGPFLVSLEGNQDIIPGNIIGYDSILHSALVLTHFGIFTTNPRHERICTG